MHNIINDSHLDSIMAMKTVFVSAIGPNLIGATQTLLADSAGCFEYVARVEILSARRLSTSHRVSIAGHEDELWEVWEFEVFTHQR
jgi:hypothetical protein